MSLKPNLFKAFLVGGVVFIFSFLIRFASIGTEVFSKDLYIFFLYCMLYSIVLYVVNASLFVYLDKVFKDGRFSTKRILIGFTSSFFISLFVIFLLRIFTQVVIEKRPIISFLANERAASYIESSVITFIILLIFHALHFYRLYQENKVTQQKIIAGTANAKFESLKNQIDPHFLFNSLNVLSSLIEENPDNAQRFTTSLSKIYRYVLEQKDKELVSVEDELSFAKTYMNLLKMRFENSLFYELPATTDINPDAKVVPLSLQLLLENTVKHNIVSEQKPLHIKIFVDGDYLAIQNVFQKKEVLQDRQGVGLQNIVDRYGIITNRKVLIEQNKETFTVKIPILTKQITVMDASVDYNDENKAYFRAKKRVEELKGFYGNILSYCCVIPFLIFINLKFSPGFQWFWFSALGWGFGVVMHAFKVFGYSSDWEERKIRQILEKENNNQKNWK
ncbi:2TM domain-containing protein [Flavobacterium pectinovorum]|uniref:2TM domain-containing protein n=1 Tax=Flavobacterium pectinovorum TaxID=29533 RepID=A0AB36P6R1_9FLAO|nr:histidine kinase [Flavobacterium pectinovorum]OXB08102.1 histidine kinase [Flavobacterium pectinovorum]SHM49609.1 2TM domain-containing protein [Flavobacterium pectinovorum]